VRRLATAPVNALQGALAARAGLSYLMSMETHDPSSFDVLIWGGTAMSLLGLAGLMYCIVRVSRAKRTGLDDAAMRDELKKVVPLNLGALFLSVIGLMIVIIGIFLG
jgi:hypothetical protein